MARPAAQRHSGRDRPEREEIGRLRALALAGAGGLRTGAHWEQFLRRAERNADLGFVSTMLIWAQRPEAIQLRTYQEWQLAGRHVLRGEQAVRLIVPDSPKRPDADGSERIRRLFDLMQTEGNPVPVQLPRLASGAKLQPAAWRELAALAVRENVFVPGAARGDLSSAGEWMEWVIRSHGGDTAMAAAVVLARRVAGHLVRARDRSGIPAGGWGGGVEEDSVAFLLARRLGLDTSGFSFPSVGSWAGTDERARPDTCVAAMGERVLSTAQRAFACLGTGHAVVIRLVTGPRMARTDTTPVTGAAVNPDGEAARIQHAAARFFAGARQGSWVPGYLASRGFSEDIQQRWGIGYAPASWTALTAHLRELGYGDDAIEASGLAKRSARGTLIDVFRDRAMFPVRSPDGMVLGFTGRAPGSAAAEVPKYLNSRQTSLYSKGQVLFGLHEARQPLAAGAQAVIVEGPLDAIAVTEAGGGRYAGVAPCGTALTGGQVAALRQYTKGPETRALIAFDGDAAGQRAISRAWDLLAEHAAQSSCVSFPPGQDPASLLREQGSAALIQALDQGCRPLADLVVDARLAAYGQWLDYIEGKFNALHAVAPMLARLPAGQVARQVARVAANLDLTHAEVTAAVTEALDDITQGTVLSGTARDQQDPTPVSSPLASPCRPARRRTATGSGQAARKAV